MCLTMLRIFFFNIFFFQGVLLLISTLFLLYFLMTWAAATQSILGWDNVKILYCLTDFHVSQEKMFVFLCCIAVLIVFL